MGSMAGGGDLTNLVCKKSVTVHHYVVCELFSFFNGSGDRDHGNQGIQCCCANCEGTKHGGTAATTTTKEYRSNSSALFYLCSLPKETNRKSLALYSCNSEAWRKIL